MSADNGIYILKSKDEYRVIHTQAIENIYYLPVCCNDPKIIDKDPDSIEIIEICLNCGKENPNYEERSKINPIILKQYFGESKIFKTENEAMEEAKKLYNEIMNDDFYPIVECGIQLINYDGEFPK